MVGLKDYRFRPQAIEGMQRLSCHAFRIRLCALYLQKPSVFG